MTQELPPMRDQTILVPTSRPDTAQLMIELALSMVDPDEGKVIALVVSLNDSEQASEILDTIQPVIDAFQNDGHPVELRTDIAVKVSRGILDFARENGVDGIIMGAHIAERGNVELGPVVENVMIGAPCDVYVYRFASENSLTAPLEPLREQGFRKIVVPTKGIPYSEISLKVGQLLADSYDVPIQQMAVPQTAVGDFAIKDTFAIQLTSFVQLLSRHDNLLVLSFPKLVNANETQSDDLSEQLLNYSRGPVLLVSSQQWSASRLSPIRRALQRMNPILTVSERKELMWEAQKSSSANIDYLLMIVLSAGLASAGLLLNSGAVIIGAMLVAPLMQPLAAASTSLVTGQRTIARSITTLALGVLLSLVISFALGALLPVNIITPEMLSRGNPNVLDAAVALTSGFVAAYATARKGIPAALAGVAIAAALMPPLCTVGLAFALGDSRLAFGALLLFLVNISFIVIAQVVIFLWLGLRPTRDDQRSPIQAVWFGVLILLSVVLVFVLFDLTNRATTSLRIEEIMQGWQGAEVTDLEVLDENPLRVIATLRTQEELNNTDLNALYRRIERVVGEPVALEVVIQPVFQVIPEVIDGEG